MQQHKKPINEQGVHEYHFLIHNQELCFWRAIRLCVPKLDHFFQHFVKDRGCSLNKMFPHNVFTSCLLIMLIMPL